MIIHLTHDVVSWQHKQLRNRVCGEGLEMGSMYGFGETNGCQCALFLPHEAKVIKSIPLSMHLPADKQVWACCSIGVFTVRSAYWVAVEISKGVGNGSCSDSRQNRKFWRKIWELATPQKIRHFT